MKALLALKSAMNQSTLLAILALIIIAPLALPHLAAAAELQTLGQPAEFQIKISDSSVLSPSPKSNQPQNSLTIQTLAESDPLVTKLKQYLKDNNSPMAEDAAQFVQYEQWQRGLAISFVESNFCAKAKNRNCTSIGVAPGHRLWRKYATYGDWMADMSKLMEKPLYKDRLNTFEKMKGVYVVPGSKAWVNGAQRKYDELMALTAEAETERQELAQLHSGNVALATFSDNQN